jgi:hypothetical protein
MLGAKFQNFGPKSVPSFWQKNAEIFSQKFTASQNFFFSQENNFYLFFNSHTATHGAS